MIFFVLMHSTCILVHLSDNESQRARLKVFASYINVLAMYVNNVFEAGITKMLAQTFDTNMSSSSFM